MKNIYLVFFLLSFSILAFGQQPDSADIALERTDKKSQIAHQQLLEKTKKGRIDTYFLGDSITRRWGTSDEKYRSFYENWQKNFFGWNAGNFGWGGDTTQNILWRISNGELDNVNPKVIVILAGTNNVGNKAPGGDIGPKAENIAKGIKAILDICRQKAPTATIILMGIFPRNDNMAVMPLINKINENISKFADGRKIKYVNVNKKMADKTGKLFPQITVSDGLHLDLKGYQVWADALKPIFKKILGSPAKEDQAPPPTGEPVV
jgi:lysophospholipase L1-like esterase